MTRWIKKSKDIGDEEFALEEDNLMHAGSILSTVNDEEALALRRKKTILERVLKRLRELIIASQPTGKIVKTIRAFKT